MVSGFWTPGTRSREGESRYPLGYIGSRSAAFFFSKSQRPSIPTTKVRNFFDMSDHEIVGGCSTLLAKSNKKMHFSRPNYIPCSRNRTKKCIFRDQGLVYIKKMFYHSFMEARPNDEHFWAHHISSPQVNTYWGLSYERVCMVHIPQIKKAIGIDQIGTECYSWRSNDPEQRAQVDLLIERADRIINLCEIKYSTSLYLIDKEEDMKFRTRQGIFVAQTGTRYGVQPTFITTYGLARGAYASSIQKSVTMDDLFS